GSLLRRQRLLPVQPGRTERSRAGDPCPALDHLGLAAQERQALRISSLLEAYPSGIQMRFIGLSSLPPASACRESATQPSFKRNSLEAPICRVLFDSRALPTDRTPHLLITNTDGLGILLLMGNALPMSHSS